LMLATRARALLAGRLSPSLDDVVALAVPVLKHRMALTFAARAEGETVSDLVIRLAKRLG
jgi:MoxR-like ATPase